jgi:hypothetical protein
MRLETIPGTGHHLFLTHTALVMGLILGFLEAGESPPIAVASH